MPEIDGAEPFNAGGDWGLATNASPTASTATHSDDDAHDTLVRELAPGIGSTVHADPLLGLPSSAFPLLSTTTQSLVDPHATALRRTPLVSIAVGVGVPGAVSYTHL